MAIIMEPKQTSIDGVEPVTLDQAKDQCYILRTNTDTTLEALLDNRIKTARIYGENRTWRSLIDKTLEWKMDAFPVGIIEVPKPPLISISSITYLDGDGDSQTLVEDTDFRVDSDTEPGRLEPIDSWPSTKDQVNAVTITYKAGYEDTAGTPDTSNVPQDIKDGLLMLIKYLYDNRDTIILPDRNVEYIPAPIGTNSLLDAHSMRTP